MVVGYSRDRLSPREIGLASVLVVWSLSGCGADRSGPTSLIGGDSIPLVEEWRIGAIDGEESYTFGSVSDVMPAPDGSVYVADRHVPVVRKYDARGLHLLDIGRRGEGPGEFESVDALGMLENGELVVWDARLNRVSYFDPGGSLVSSFQFASGLADWRTFSVAPDGTIYSTIQPEGGARYTRAGYEMDWGVVTPDRQVRRLRSRPLPDRVGPFYDLVGRGGDYLPFVTATMSTMSVDGSYFEARNDEYRIGRIRPDGTTSVIARDGPRIALTPEELAEWQERSRHLAERQPQRRADYFPIPTAKPFIRELAADRDGRLWVSRYTEAAFMEYSEAERADRAERSLPSYNWRDRLRWDLFDSSDEYLGFVTLPFKTSFIEAAGDRIWGVRAGDFDEEYVVQWRMVGQGN